MATLLGSFDEGNRFRKFSVTCRLVAVKTERKVMNFVQYLVLVLFPFPLQHFLINRRFKDKKLLFFAC